MSRDAAAGAGSRALMTSKLSFTPLLMTIIRPPPTPHTAASTACPPSFNTSLPVAEQIQWSAATMPPPHCVDNARGCPK
eukprot:CAMPEP_0202337722 /NCGR_PEP_ID=MMETSP1126-20121109/294_1 /ASSEMBLY_ACC=CAM_ASM_000457 /TAXON_ID=3047 /ORGANISM="Dunaliella tertiolecta, Strain CCMP1320" /LENGTH=78 /DNA_ID=CAMNT_0048927977 /DNA_START=642 /DNA_END=878 /DNA_ORIENTATION=-